MNFIGFEFTKISGTTNKNSKALNISNSISFDSIEKENIPTLGDLNTLKATFTYRLDYSESKEQNKKGKEDATIECKGCIFLSTSPEEEKELLKFSKKKDYSSPMLVPLFNFVMHKCNIKSFQLEDDLGLRPHFAFPKITAQKKEN